MSQSQICCGGQWGPCVLYHWQHSVSRTLQNTISPQADNGRLGNCLFPHAINWPDLISHTFLIPIRQNTENVIIVGKIQEKNLTIWSGKLRRIKLVAIDQSHRYGRPQAACREPAGSYDKTTRTAICLEHKTQYLLIRAPYSRIVVFWHISIIPPWFRRVKLVVIPPRII